MRTSVENNFRSGIRTGRGLAVCLVALVVVLGLGSWYVSQFMSSTIKPRYAVEWVVLFIAEHLDKNDGAWPRDWSDLADDYSAREAGAYPFSFDELQTLVDVRWDIELPRDEQLFADEGFQVVKVPASNGFRHVLEPDVVTWNRELRDYVIGEPSKWLRDNISRPE